MELRKLACVDDDPFVSLMVEAALETPTLKVVRFTSGGRAITGLTHVQPQLVLLDMVMPDLDGVQVLHALRENSTTTNIPVVFLTGRAEPHDVGYYLEQGATHVIPKPFDPCMLNHRVQRIWQEICRKRLH